MSATRLEVVIACGDDLDENLSRTIDSLRRSIGPEDRICVVLDRPRDAATVKADRVIQLSQPLGCGGARHVGIATSCAEYIALVDAHMDFPDGFWAYECAKHIAAHPKDITCAHMQSMDWEWRDTPGQRYAGAHMVEMQIAPVRQCVAFCARWNRVDIGEGEVGAPMGACYAMRRERYHEIGAPLQYLRRWGMDEELLAAANWIAGGRTWLLPTCARHVYGAPQRTPKELTPRESALVWGNRLFCIRALPMHEETRASYIAHLRQTSFVDVNFMAIHRDVESRNPSELERALSRHGRTFEDFMAVWHGPSDTTHEENERMKRAKTIDDKRKRARPETTPSPTPPETTRPPEPEAKDDTPFACPHCGWSDIASKHQHLGTYPNGRRRYACARCRMPFIAQPTSMGTKTK